MSVAIAVKKGPHGEILARRLDGQALTDADRAEAKAIAELVPEAPRAWVVQEHRSAAGELLAAEICSAILQDHLFVVFEPHLFTPPAGAVAYTTSELAALREKDPARVLYVHEAKRALGGGMVLQ